MNWELWVTQEEHQLQTKVVQRVISKNMCGQNCDSHSTTEHKFWAIAIFKSKKKKIQKEWSELGAE